MKEFGIKSKSFPLYEAFKKEAEALGYKYNNNFTEWEERRTKDNTGLYFSEGYSGELYGKKAFAFTNWTSGDRLKTFNLETQYGEAIEHLKKIIADEPKVKTLLNGVNVQIHPDHIRYGGQRVEKSELLAILKLMKS